MSELPNCIPQEIYRPDEDITEWLEDEDQKYEEMKKLTWQELTADSYQL